MGAKRPIAHVYYEDNYVSLSHLQEYSLAIYIKVDEGLLVDNARKFGLSFLWTERREVSFAEIMGHLPDCTSEAIVQDLIKAVAQDMEVVD